MRSGADAQQERLGAKGAIHRDLLFVTTTTTSMVLAINDVPSGQLWWFKIPRHRVMIHRVRALGNAARILSSEMSIGRARRHWTYSWKIAVTA